MEPINRGQLEHNIEAATVVFLDTGESKELHTKPHSVCHFFEPFQIGNDTITLRLDWSDLDENGNPTLDADFFATSTKKKRSLKGERKDAHHTSSKHNEGRSYTWEFKSYRRPFRILVRWLSSVSLTVKSRFSVSVEVIRATDKGPR